METNRTPPNNLEAEQSVLGSILIDNEAFSLLDGLIEPVHFYKESHRKIFSACEVLYHREEPIDLVTLTEELRQSSQLEAVGNVPYLIGLAEGVPTAAYVQSYATIVKEKAILRDLISESGQTIQRAFDQVLPVDEILEEAESGIFKISTGKKLGNVQNMSTLAPESFSEIEHAMNNPNQMEGISLGFKELDGMFSGLDTGMHILAARASMGKTAMALTIGEHVARKEGAVAIFSLEMNARQLTKRFISMGSRVDASRIKTGGLTDRDFQRMTDYTGKLSNFPIFIEDSTTLSLGALNSISRNLKLRQDVKLIIIDYIQLMSGAGNTRQEEISNISRGIKKLSGHLDVPIIVLSQLSRAVETRPNKRPMLSDLRESGALEQDADSVTFIYRDEYYNPETEDQGIAEVIIGKQRSGPVGTVKLQFHNSHVRFNSLYAEPNMDKKEQAKQNNQAKNTSQNLDDVYRGG